ncbi:MAG TPA: hypothetical protein VME47_02575 [Acetobacteraceae bacterium]|nr:hypothetical protein [Acetobacteraceae bacterium]
MRNDLAAIDLAAVDLAAVVTGDRARQSVPERAGAEDRENAEVAADLGKGAADRAAADFGLDLLWRGQMVGIDGRVMLRTFGNHAPGLLLERLGIRIGGGRRRFGGGSWLHVAAGGGALQQHGFERGGAQEAAGEVGENQRNPRSAEGGREDEEARARGTPLERGRHVAAVFEQGADDIEERRDVAGQGLPGPILLGIGFGGQVGGGVRYVLHVRHTK